MSFDGFCLSSDVAEAPITAEMGAALLCNLRRVEAWWPSGRLTSGPAQLLWSSVIGVAPIKAGRYVSIRVVQALPDAPGDIAYHTVDTDGDPLCLISWAAVQSEGGTLTGPNGLLSAISHETCECDIDPFCEIVVALPTGGQTSKEVSDWVQGTDYEELPGYFVANAIGPRFFVPGSTGKLDIASDVGRGAVTTAFQETSGGYHDVIAANGSQTLVFGEAVPEMKRVRLLRTGPRGGQRWAGSRS